MRPGWPRVDPSPGPRRHPAQPAQRHPALRALFVALEEWVTKGTAPPPSRVPRIADGTAVMAESIKMPTVPGFAHAPGANPIVPPVAWTDPQGRIDNVYGVRVFAVDADGNEIAGIRLPIAVPLGTYTGWNVYREQPRELADRDGSFYCFRLDPPEARDGS
jgi:Alpha/beta hydrolase domain